MLALIDVIDPLSDGRQIFQLVHFFSFYNFINLLLRVIINRWEIKGIEQYLLIELFVHPKILINFFGIP